MTNDVHVYVGGRAGTAGAEGHNIGAANVSRPDVAGAYPYTGALHGFDTVITTTKRGSVPVCAYGIDIGQGDNRELSSSCMTVTVMPAPPGASATPSVAVDGPTVTLSWPPTPSPDSPVTSYQIEVGNTDAGTTELLTQRTGDVGGVRCRIRPDLSVQGSSESAAGNGAWSPWSAPVEITDVLAPVVDVVSPVSGAVVVDSVGVVASGVVSDDVGLDRVRVGLLSTEGAGWYVAPGRESRFEVVGLSGVSGEFRVEFPGAPVGSYLVRVSAIDTAGNRSVWLSVPVTVVADELAPVVDVVSPVSGAVVVDSVGVVASGVVSDDVGLDRVRVGLLSTEGAGWYVAPGRESAL